MIIARVGATTGNGSFSGLTCVLGDFNVLELPFVLDVCGFVDMDW